MTVSTNAQPLRSCTPLLKRDYRRADVCEMELLFTEYRALRNTWWILRPLSRVAKYCDHRVRVISLSACLLAYLKTICPNCTNFSVHVTCGRGSVLLGRQRSRLPNVMYFRFCVMFSAARSPITRHQPRNSVFHTVIVSSIDVGCACRGTWKRSIAGTHKRSHCNTGRTLKRHEPLAQTNQRTSDFFKTKTKF